METYDPAKVGRRVAWGRSHSVYKYGEDEVIRFPHLESWAFPELSERLQRDTALCKKYLGEYVLDTRVVSHPTTGHIATIQPYLHGQYLSKKDLSDPVARRHFEKFMARYNVMAGDGYEIDLVGQGGVLRRRLSNVMVLPDKSIRVFDAIVADTVGLRPSLRPFFPLLKRLVLWRQATVIRYLRS